MTEYDASKLTTAIQLLKQMAHGINPVTSQPVPEDSYYNNPDVIRSLFFIKTVMTDVANNGGVIGRKRATHKHISEQFPYEVLSGFQYRTDLQITLFLKQLQELLPEGQEIRLPATDEYLVESRTLLSQEIA